MASPKPAKAADTPRTGVVHKVDLPFSFLPDDFTPPAAAGRGGAAASSPFTKMIEGAPIGKWWYAPITPSTLENPDEREADDKDKHKKLLGSINSAVRTFKKKNAGAAFLVQRTDYNGQKIVSVKRTA